MTPLRFISWIIRIIPFFAAVTGNATEKPLYPDTIPPKEAARETGDPTVVEELTVGQPVSTCEKVTCGGHGQCVLKQTGPVCACEPNYLPDQATGLHCVLAVQLQYTVPAIPYQDARTLQRQARAEERAREQQLRRHAKAALKDHPDYPGLRTKRRLGLAGVITGSIAMGVGCFMGLTLAPWDDDLALASGVTAALGLAVFIPGIVTASTARRRINRLYKEEIEKRKHGFGVQLSGVAPMVSLDGKGAGIGATFQF
jgi:hypothetical protein